MRAGSRLALEARGKWGFPRCVSLRRRGNDCSFFSSPTPRGPALSSARFEASRADSAMRAVAACTARHVAASRSVASRAAWCRPPRRGTPARASLRASSAASSAAPDPSFSERETRKTLYLIRHGRTEMNEYLARHRWDDARFTDPMLFDTRLTSEGEAQAVALRAITEKLKPEPQLIVASPLRRALRTAELAFGLERYAATPRVTCVHARERVFHASDVGRPASEVRRDFPEWCVEELRAAHGDDAPWWYAGGDDDVADDADLSGGTKAKTWTTRVHKQTENDGETDDESSPVLRSGVPSEPSEVFEARMARLKAWLESRPESHIAIVAHWGVWFSLTGREFENCELVTLDVDDLEPGRGKMPG